MKAFLLSLAAAALASFAVPATAQDTPSDEQAVLATVNAFMAAFDAKDAAAMTGLITEDAQLAWVREGEGGEPSQSLLLQEAAERIAAVPAEIAEPLDIRAVMVERPVAMVWADYGFYIGGEQSHCGVDIFTLMRIGGSWKIASITYSHQTEGCEDAPRP